MPPFPRHKWHLHNGGDPALTARILIHCYPRMQLLRFAALPPRLPPDIGASSLLIPPPSRCTRRRARVLRSSREKELALGCTYAFNRPVWNRPQGPHDAQAPHRAFIVRSSSKFDAGSIATLRTAVPALLTMRPARLSWMEQLQRMRPSSLLRRLHSSSV